MDKLLELINYIKENNELSEEDINLIDYAVSDFENLEFESKSVLIDSLVKSYSDDINDSKNIEYFIKSLDNACTFAYDIYNTGVEETEKEEIMNKAAKVIEGANHHSSADALKLSKGYFMYDEEGKLKDYNFDGLKKFLQNARLSNKTPEEIEESNTVEVDEIEIEPLKPKKKESFFKKLFSKKSKKTEESVVEDEEPKETETKETKETIETQETTDEIEVEPLKPKKKESFFKKLFSKKPEQTEEFEDEDELYEEIFSESSKKKSKAKKPKKTRKVPKWIAAVGGFFAGIGRKIKNIFKKNKKEVKEYEVEVDDNNNVIPKNTNQEQENAEQTNTQNQENNKQTNTQEQKDVLPINLSEIKSKTMNELGLDEYERMFIEDADAEILNPEDNEFRQMLNERTVDRNKILKYYLLLKKNVLTAKYEQLDEMEKALVDDLIAEAPLKGSIIDDNEYRQMVEGRTVNKDKIYNYIKSYEEQKNYEESNSKPSIEDYINKNKTLSYSDRYLGKGKLN